MISLKLTTLMATNDFTNMPAVTDLSKQACKTFIAVDSGGFEKFCPSRSERSHRRYLHCCLISGVQPQPQVLREEVDGLHRRRGIRRHHRAPGQHQPCSRHPDDQEE